MDEFGSDQIYRSAVQAAQRVNTTIILSVYLAELACDICQPKQPGAGVVTEQSMEICLLADHVACTTGCSVAATDCNLREHPCLHMGWSNRMHTWIWPKSSERKSLALQWPCVLLYVFPPVGLIPPTLDRMRANSSFPLQNSPKMARENFLVA